MLLTFSEWMKMKKSPFKQKMSKGTRDIEDDLSKDYKGHLEKLGTVEPFKLKKEAVEYLFHPGDRVRHGRLFYKVGEVTSCVPGDGRTPWYFVSWEDGTEDRYTGDELEVA